MSRPYYAVYLSREELAYYLKRVGIENADEFIVQNFCKGIAYLEPSAEKLLDFADHVYFRADLSYLQSMTEMYGECGTEDMVGHIAEEIMDYAGHVVLEF